ncbi:MAG: ATP-binding cassette domain-containing protein [Calditrichaeota bacterium]|nr:MAG: ATP-binding cassette domain-containing protein [Calditrichota bacterium]
MFTTSTNIIEQLFNQPGKIPEPIAEAISKKTGGEKIRLYAFCDLNNKQQFTESWIVLTKSFFFIVDKNGDGEKFKTIPVDEIINVEIVEGFTLNRLYLRGKDGILLAEISFTRRQYRAVANIHYLLSQTIKKHSDEQHLQNGFNADEKYYEALNRAFLNSRGTAHIKKKGMVTRLLGYAKPYKKRIIFSLLASIGITFLHLLPPALMRILIDDVLKPVKGSDIAAANKQIWMIIGALAAIWTTAQVAHYFRTRTMNIVGEAVARDLRYQLYQHVQRLSLSFFNTRSTGNILSRITHDTDRIWEFIAHNIIDVLISILMMIGVGTALFMHDPYLAKFVIIPLPLMIVFVYLLRERLNTVFLRFSRRWSALTSLIGNVIPGIRVVKAFAQEEKEKDRFSQKNKSVFDTIVEAHNYWSLVSPFLNWMMHLCSLIVWIFGAPRVLEYIITDGQSGMSLGVFIAFTSYLWMFLGPIQVLGNMVSSLSRATAASSRMFEILDTKPTIVDMKNPTALEPLQGRVQFENVFYSYDGIRQVIKGISFDVKPGEVIGLVGPSGGGKSTLANLICRFYDITDGEIRIDGVNIRDIELSSFRRQIGVVLQEPYLFHGTIEENIAYGKPNAGLGDIIEAAKAANAHEFICGFPDAYDSLVGERGLTLSGGERQRISIARAILNDPRVLILDEATSSVDSGTEKKIQEALDNLVKGRTTFAIAHRLTTLRHAHRIFVIEAGKLVESGTHETLLANTEGKYFKLHETQNELQAMMYV